LVELQEDQYPAARREPRPRLLRCRRELVAATDPDVPEQRQGLGLVQVAPLPHCTSSTSTTGTTQRTSQPLCDSSRPGLFPSSGSASFSLSAAGLIPSISRIAIASRLIESAYADW